MTVLLRRLDGSDNPGAPGSARYGSSQAAPIIGSGAQTLGTAFERCSHGRRRKSSPIGPQVGRAVFLLIAEDVKRSCMGLCTRPRRSAVTSARQRCELLLIGGHGFRGLRGLCGRGSPIPGLRIGESDGSVHMDQCTPKGPAQDTPPGDK